MQKTTKNAKLFRNFHGIQYVYHYTWTKSSWIINNSEFCVLLLLTVQFTPKLTLTCTEHACVLQLLLSDSVQTCMSYTMSCRQVNFCALHASYILCTACDPYFVYYTIVRSTWVILHVLYAVSRLVCCTQVNYYPLPERNQGIQWNGMLAKHDKMHGHKENSILSSIYVLLF